MAAIPKTYTSLGLLAHVDAGKTTLSEAMLYLSGAKRTLGRVDHGDAFLDTHFLERQRGITIFSKQALFSLPSREVTLVDTPGHADFGSEAERVMPILDCAVLVISSTDGVQAHTLTLWELLKRYRVPVFLFINKQDLPGKTRQELMDELRAKLSPSCVDFGANQDEIFEQAAMCDEALLENYLESGVITQGNLRQLIAGRKLFPCCFGSALKLEGVQELLALVDSLAPKNEYPDTFAAKVYKISRDAQGNRLTWLKVTGGSLAVRSPLRYRDAEGAEKEEKPVQLRLYSAEKFTAAETVRAGQLCAVTGLSTTYAGQGLGAQAAASRPILESVMTYRLALPPKTDPVTVLPRLRQLEEEDPQLRLVWQERTRQIHLQLMGKVQLEVLKNIIAQRFSLEVSFDTGRIHYKETIADTVEGVGHFEPLRHYAECHLLLEPLATGSGLVFDSVCSTDVLELGYQRLILTHLEEKVHRGVLTGAPITDMKITLLIGRAHLKHTEGGDFRQATYRAVRQGLMQAKSVLLEPWYAFTLTLPAPLIGRAITDIRAMSGDFGTPETLGEMARLTGSVPASEVGDYAADLAAYSQGRGVLQLRLKGYFPCHDQEKVVAEAGYDPEADLENTPDSVFCAHGAGFTVKWDQVKDYMHLESGLKTKPQVITQNLAAEEKALEAILKREFGDQTTRLYRPPQNRDAGEKLTIKPLKQQYLIVDGYNIIFAWEDLAQVAKTDLDTARDRLIDRLSSFAAFKKCRLVLVFDGYNRPGNPGEKANQLGIHVVFTPQGQTADGYIEELVGKIGPNYAVRVATSDGLIQLSSLRSGVLRVSARELEEEVNRAREEMKKYY